MRELQRGLDKPCQCVFRGIFRTCYEHFRECANATEQPGAVTLERNQGRSGYRIFSLKRQEYAADFCLAARRALSEQEYRIFRYAFLLRADAVLCCRYLEIDQGFFFHELYRVEETLGRYFAELRPYPLYPIDEYMGGAVRTRRMMVRRETVGLRRRRERLPMSA